MGFGDDWQDPNDIPESPIGEMTASGMDMYTIYEANKEAGFTSDQSLYIVASLLTGSPGPAPGETEDDAPPEDT